MQNGLWYEPYVLQQYRANRDSTLWRSTREVEKLCEYVLHLEGELGMSTVIETTCDTCGENLGVSKKSPDYYIRLSNVLMDSRRDENDSSNEKPILDKTKDFCNLNCLKKWSNS